MKPKRKRVVIYLRISLDRDDQQSSENQEREARDYCQAKDWEVVGVYQDLGKSGYKPDVKRPGFDRAMAMVETKQADMFLVWKVSRFIRRIREFHMFLNTLIKAGGGFDSVTDPVDYMTASGELLLAMTAGFAQMESAAKADFARSWNEGRTLKGACPQGPRPFGYQRLARTEAPRNSQGLLVSLVPDTAEALALVSAAEQLLAGVSLRAILKGFPVDGSKGKPMTLNGLRSALKNPTTAGLRAIRLDDGSTRYVEGCWEPILDRATWDGVCGILADPERQTADGNQIRHLLSGLLVCGKCDGRLGVRKWKPTGQTGGYRYTCFACGNSGGKEVLDQAAKARLLALIDQKTWKALREQGRGYSPQVIADIEAEQLKLAEMWKRQQISMDVFSMMNGELVTRMAQATGAEPLDLPDVKNLAQAWDTMNVLDQRRVLGVVFSLIKLDPANGSRDTVGRMFMRRAV